MLSTQNIHYSIGKKQILANISAVFKPGTCNMILGPNGSGKSSFLKIFSGDINTFEGKVLYNNIPINNIKKEVLAMQRAVMSQQPDLQFPLMVAEVVMMGRYPHFNYNPSKKDENICHEVMQLMDLTSFKERNYLTLSGGEKQRVQFARVLAQIWETPTDGYRYLFLDEPLNNLDVKYQQSFLQIAKSFVNNRTVVVAIMHDINLATQYADNIVFLKDGVLVADGSPSSIVNASLIKQVFDVDTSIINHPATNKPFVMFA